MNATEEETLQYPIKIENMTTFKHPSSKNEIKPTKLVLIALTAVHNSMTGTLKVREQAGSSYPSLKENMVSVEKIKHKKET